MRLALMLTLMACSTSQQAAQQVVDEAVEAAPATEATHAAALERADAADGTVDKVVEKCASCRLGMDGDAAHAVTHEGYELHFCSDSCKDRFEADPDAVIKNL